MQIDMEHLLESAKLTIDNGNLPPLLQLQQELMEMITEILLPEAPVKILSLEKAEAMLLREDKIQSSISREEALLNAPQKQAGCFVVPKIV